MTHRECPNICEHCEPEAFHFCIRPAGHRIGGGHCHTCDPDDRESAADIEQFGLDGLTDAHARRVI